MYVKFNKQLFIVVCIQYLKPGLLVCYSRWILPSLCGSTSLTVLWATRVVATSGMRAVGAGVIRPNGPTITPWSLPAQPSSTGRQKFFLKMDVI